MNRLHLMAMLLFAALPLMAERVAPETARKAATTFFNNNGAKSVQLTDHSKAAGFQNLYIFTTEHGFVVMAADDCAYPILGYSLDGYFSPIDMPDNVRGWLHGYNDQIQAAIESKAKPSADVAKQWKDLIEGNSKAAKATTVVAPLITTKWDQTSPYNNSCPYLPNSSARCVTGCGATAMAQILKYWGYPSRGIGTAVNYHNGNTLSVDFGATTYNWNNMPNALGGYYNNNQYITVSATTQQQQAVATLMYHCGMALMMEYGSESLSSSLCSTWAFKDNFNYTSTLYREAYSSYNHNNWINKLKLDLDARRPIFYGGGSESGGHAFVCDGYDNNDYFHFNFGWRGLCDGSFLITAVSVTVNNQNYNFSEWQDAVFGIKPSVCTAEAPTSLTGTLIGRTVSLNWPAANGATSYAVYRNNVLVATLNTTTYSETAPIGRCTYFVRSKDSSPDMSLASNSVTFTIADQALAVNDLEASVSNDNVKLSWTIPSRPGNVVLSSQESDKTYIRSTKYIANRFKKEFLSQHAGKAICKVSTPISGAATLRIYNHTIGNKPNPDSLVVEKNIHQNGNAFWTDFILDKPVLITGTSEIWVVVELNVESPARYFETYIPDAPISSYYNNYHFEGLAEYQDGNWAIRTCITDNCNYSIYRNDEQIGEAQDNTNSFLAPLIDNAISRFYVKTKYNNTESGPSNVVSVAKGNTSVANLNLSKDNKMVIKDGTTLTVSGTLTNDDAANLVIGDMAQLIHSNEGVKATVKKGITPYKTQEDGWHFIASPVATNLLAPSEVGGLLGTDNDLYCYHEPSQKWINQKQHQDFGLASTQGYLYSCGGESSAVSMKDLVFGFTNGLEGWTTFNTSGGNVWYSNSNGGLVSTNANNYLVSPQVIFSSSTKIQFIANNGPGRNVRDVIRVYYTSANFDAYSSLNDLEMLAEYTLTANDTKQVSLSLPAEIEGTTGHIVICHSEKKTNLTVSSMKISNVLEDPKSIISFQGQVKGSASTVQVPLSHTNNINLAGFNLVGNPFVCNATIDFGDFFVMNADGSEITLAEAGHQIGPCEAVFVKATESGQSVTFSKAATASKGHSHQAVLDLVVKRGKTIIDRARVRLGEGNNMEKFRLNGDQGSRIYFPNGGNDYAVTYIASSDDARNGSAMETPVNFKAAKNGTYTLAVEANSLDVDYLHLIDNMTGTDIDLLHQPEYTFSAKTTDYASRFRLLFAPNREDAVGDNAPFAYVSNGEIVITADAMGDVVGDAGTASLQVVDVMGRVVVSVGGHTRCVPTTGIPAGVYVLRLIGGNNVRSQKILIE